MLAADWLTICASDYHLTLHNDFLLSGFRPTVCVTCRRFVVMTYTTADDRMMRVRHNAGTRKASQVNALLVCALFFGVDIPRH